MDLLREFIRESISATFLQEGVADVFELTNLANRQLREKMKDIGWVKQNAVRDDTGTIVGVHLDDIHVMFHNCVGLFAILDYDDELMFYNPLASQYMGVDSQTGEIREKIQIPLYSDPVSIPRGSRLVGPEGDDEIIANYREAVNLNDPFTYHEIAHLMTAKRIKPQEFSDRVKFGVDAERKLRYGDDREHKADDTSILKFFQRYHSLEDFPDLVSHIQSVITRLSYRVQDIKLLSIKHILDELPSAQEIFYNRRARKMIYTTKDLEKKRLKLAHEIFLFLKRVNKSSSDRE